MRSSAVSSINPVDKFFHSPDASNPCISDMRVLILSNSIKFVSGTSTPKSSFIPTASENGSIGFNACNSSTVMLLRFAMSYHVSPDVTVCVPLSTSKNEPNCCSNKLYSSRNLCVLVKNVSSENTVSGAMPIAAITFAICAAYSRMVSKPSLSLVCKPASDKSKPLIAKVAVVAANAMPTGDVKKLMVVSNPPVKNINPPNAICNTA